MSHNHAKRAANQQSQQTQKSDLWLVDAIKQGGHDAEVNQAWQVLQERYQAEVERYLRKKLPEAWVEDVMQEIWLGLYHRIYLGEIKVGVANVLWGIARNKRAAASIRLKREREIEKDVVAKDIVELDVAPEDIAKLSDAITRGESLDDILAKTEMWQQKELTLDVLAHLPLFDTVLSDCQRVLWILREVYNYSSKTVGRLLGKQVTNINVQTYKARNSVHTYFVSEDFQFALAAQALPPPWQPPPLPANALIVDRFTEQPKPQFTPDELKPLGLTNAELQTEYITSLMLPWGYDQYHVVDLTPPYLLLTRKPDWATFQRIFAQLAQHPNEINDEFPEECLVRLDVIDDTIQLQVEPMVQVALEEPTSPFFADHYLALHSPHRKIPISLGTFGPDLYTPELLQRWPFVTLP